MSRDTCLDRLVHTVSIYGSQPAIYFKDGNRWASISWAEYTRRCWNLAGALLAEGCNPGDVVAIMANGCPEWVITDVGAMLVRAVPAGIYPTCTGDQAVHILAHSNARVLILEHRDLWEQ